MPENQTYSPQHRADDQPMDAWPNLARCNRRCNGLAFDAECPRHAPSMYAFGVARHRSDR